MDSKDQEFLVLARNAFDVMIRRGWVPKKFGTSWSVQDSLGIFPLELREWWKHDFIGDPFTALVEADLWLAGKEKG